MPEVAVAIITKVVPSCSTWPEFAKFVANNLNWRELEYRGRKWSRAVTWDNFRATIKSVGLGEDAALVANALVDMGFFRVDIGPQGPRRWVSHNTQESEPVYMFVTQNF